MAHITADRVRDTSTTTGTGGFTPSASAPSGYRAFASVLATGDTFYYAIQHQTAAEWEVGLGTWGTTAFTRTTILSSSNANAIVTFSAGTKDVFITTPAAKGLLIDASGIAQAPTLYATTAVKFPDGSTQTTAAGSSYTRTAFTGTAAQTTFSVTYTVGFVQVYVNGVLLNSADYTASSGTSVVLATACISGDIVEFIAMAAGGVSTGTIAPATANQLAYFSGTNTVAGSSSTIDGSGNLKAVFGAGTTMSAPALLTSGTNLTTATAGAVEYDGKVVYATPAGAQRGILPAAQYFRLNSALAGANATGVQNVFGVGVTLASSTIYQFEFIFAMVKTAGTTSHTVSIGFGGTATLNNIMFTAVDQYNSANFATGTPALMYSTTASQTVWTSAITLAAMTVIMSCRGSVSIATGGTFIPQYALSAAPGGAYSTAIGSHMLIYPVGAAGANVNVGTWA